MSAEHQQPADLEQRGGRAVRHGIIVQIVYYFAGDSTGDESQVRDTDKPQAPLKEPRGR